MERTKKILTVDKLSLTIRQDSYEKSLLCDVSFSLLPGETLALIGASGSGKSLTSLAIMGLLPSQIHKNGNILFDETHHLLKYSSSDWQKIRGNEIAMVFQEPMSALNPIMSCGNQLVEVILQHQKVSAKEAKSIALGWLHKVRIPNPLQSFVKYPHELSGGQKQRVMIAMAMCNHPKLLIADEPTTALDVLVQKEIIDLMHELAKDFNTALIFITHDMALAKHIVDQILVLENGRIAEEQSFLQYQKTVSHKEVAFDNSERNILKINSLDIVYKAKNKLDKAVSNFTYNFLNGRTTGLVGGSGCGKSTVSKAILGLIPMAAGDISIAGKTISTLGAKEWKQLRKDIQMIFQDPYASLNPRQSVKAMLSEVVKVHSIVPKKDIHAYIIDLIEKVGLDSTALDKYPHEFSGGQRQRLCIARALAVQPKILICDESVAALDIHMQQQIVSLLKELQASLGLTYIFISHDMDIVRQIADEIIVMENGSIVEYGDVDSVMNHPKHSYTQSLIAAIP